MHSNSLAAYDELAGELSERCAEIMRAFGRDGKPLTDRDVLWRVKRSDMNSVRPRITELIQSGYLRECGSTKCPVTGKTVRLVEVKERQMELL